MVAGPQYPDDIDWPANVERIEHVPPHEHPAFYAASRFTLNVTRADMIRAGYSPSVRLFEAAACGTPIISDIWDGLDTLFEPGREIVLAGEAGRCARRAPRVDRRDRRGPRWRRRRVGASSASIRRPIAPARSKTSSSRPSGAGGSARGCRLLELGA